MRVLSAARLGQATPRASTYSSGAHPATFATRLCAASPKLALGSESALPVQRDLIHDLLSF